MRWLKAVVLAVGCGMVAGACSVASPAGPGPEQETLGQATQAITAACSFDTIGLPCDPDGPGKPKLECEGVCAIGANGLVACQVAAAGSLNGVVCGTTAGIGDAACKHYCSGKTCLASNAPAGAACRTGAGTSPCAGQCDGAGTCTSIAAPCDFGRQEQLCKFNGCDFTNATSCLIKNVAKNVLCSDADACSIGRCTNAGTCLAGAAVGCDDGNSCTDDTCDPQNGACLGTNNDSNSCSDGNACFTGEHCSAGKCVAGTVEVNCDDQNQCTTDVCDPNTGCAHIAKSCNDNDACTTDGCDPNTGACSNEPRVCDDNDLCTDDTCSAVTGCVFTAKGCDDANACTADSCAAGNCGHALIDCNDNDACTTDDCDTGSGCTHVAVIGCSTGSGGAGGEPAAGGQGGEAQVPTGGAGGEPSSNEGGMPTTPVGGSAGTAGNASSAGTAGSGGTEASSAGSAGTPVAGGSVGGSAASSGTAGLSSGGLTNDAGGAGGDDGSAGTGRVTDSGGCSCRTAGSTRPVTGSVAMALLGLVAFARRRRARTV
jgi:MYXO-CTERM domain-containing protein